MTIMMIWFILYYSFLKFPRLEQACKHQSYRARSSRRKKERISNWNGKGLINLLGKAIHHAKCQVSSDLYFLCPLCASVHMCVYSVKYKSCMIQYYMFVCSYPSLSKNEWATWGNRVCRRVLLFPTVLVYHSDMNQIKKVYFPILLLLTNNLGCHHFQKAFISIQSFVSCIPCPDPEI